MNFKSKQNVKEADSVRERRFRLLYDDCKRMMFWAWFIYPVLLVVGLAYVGKKITTLYHRADQPVAQEKVIEPLADPNSEVGRAEILGRLADSSDDPWAWSQQLEKGELHLTGWIMHAEEYRAFEAQRQADNLSVNFVGDNRGFRANFVGGEVVAPPRFASLVDEPVARGLIVLVHSLWGGRLHHHGLEVIERANFEITDWRGVPCLSVAFYCDRDQVEVKLLLEKSTMMLRQRREKYANGLEVVYTVNEFQRAGNTQQASSLDLRIGPDDLYQAQISSIRVNRPELTE